MHPKLQASYYVKYKYKVFVTLVVIVRLIVGLHPRGMMNPKLVVKNQNT
jgi:hypothetical protein